MRRSLRFRLFAGAALWVIVALVVAGLFISANFAASIERERLSDLQVSLRHVAAQIDPDLDPPLPGHDVLAGPRYALPLSGSYWQVDDLDTGKTYRSRSLWDSALTPEPDAPEDTVWTTTGPDDAPVIALTRDLDIQSEAGPRTFRIIVAETRDDPHRPLQRFSLDLLVALVILAVALSGAAYLQIAMGLRPLEATTRNVERVRRGDLSRLPADGPDEVRPLVSEVNSLLEAHESAIAHARHRAADLAHGLKTPLAVVAATAERLDGASPQEARILHMVVEEMNARIEYQLRLARLRVRAPTHGARASLNDVLLRSVAVLRKTEAGETLNWLVDLSEPLDVDLDQQDLMEVVGVVLENACKWARSRISIECRRLGDTAQFTVDDDGTGVSDDDLARLGQRGERLDTSKPGEGLGLAIVFDAVTLNGGTIGLTRSHAGGLCVDIRLPLAGSRT